MACIPNIQTIISLDFSAVTDQGNWITDSANPVLTVGGSLILDPSANNSTFRRILGVVDPTNDRIRLRSNFQVNPDGAPGPEDVEVNFDLLVGGLVIASGCAEFSGVTNQLYSYNLDRTWEIEPGSITGTVTLRITVPEGWQYKIQMQDLLAEDFFFCQDNLRTYFVIDELLPRSVTAQSAAVQLLSWKEDGAETLTPAFFAENNIIGGNPLALWKFARAAIDGSSRDSDDITPNSFNPFFDEWGMDFQNVAGNYFGGKTTGTISGSDYGPAIEQIGFEKPEVLNGNLEDQPGAFFVDLNFEKSFEVIFNVIISQTSSNPLTDPTYFRQYTIKFNKDNCERSMSYVDQLAPAGPVDQSFNAFLYGITDQAVNQTVVLCDDNFSPVGQVGNFSFILELGLDIGQTGINYNAYGVPDRFIVDYDGTIYDTGFVGLSSYDSQLLAAGVAPIDINTTPGGNGQGQLLFNKPNPLPTFCEITVEAPLGGTSWNLSGICPAPVVANIPPTVNLTSVFAGIPTGNIAQFLLSFTVDPAGSVANWSMDFGDGSPLVTGTGNPPTSFNHVYSTPGTKTATFTLFDNQGLNDSDTANVQVTSNSLVIDSQVESSCNSCLNFTVNVPAGETYDLVISSSLAPPAVYASGFCPGGTIIASDGTIVLNGPGSFNYSTGIDVAQGGSNPLSSNIFIQVKDGATTLQTFSLIRNHSNNIC